MMTRMEEELAIPLDLGNWVSAAQLREWIMTEVARLDWTNAALMELLRRHPDFEPKALLNTMTFAYAIGVFSSDEIVRRCSEEPEFHGVRPKLPPRSAELKRFRKENRGLLKWCLVCVITQALKTQFLEGQSIETLPAGLRRFVVQNATERLDIARHMDSSSELL